jgi:putative inorganic carbon (hco3(-)) transporter
VATPAYAARAGRTPFANFIPGAYPITLGLAALTCALLPAYTIRWHISLYPSTILEDAILVTVAAFLLESWRAGTMPIWRTPLTLPAAVFLVAGAISVVIAPDRRAALGIYRAYLIEPVLFFWVLANVVREVRQVWWILGGLAVAGVVVAIPNAYVDLQAIRHHTLNPSEVAPVAIFTNPNDIPLFLMPLIAIAGSLILYSTDRRIRVLSAAFMVIALGSVLVSFSRGGYLALAAVALGLALSHRRRWWLMGAAVTAAIVLILIPPINHRLAVEVDFSNGSNTLVGRFELWRVSLQMLQQHPIFGAGLSGFAQVLAPYWNPTHTDRFIYPHNIVLTFWSETGLMGLAAFAWILIVGFMKSWRLWRRGGVAWGPIGLGVLLALVGVVVHGLVDVPYFKNDLSAEFWILLGLVAAGTAWGAGRTTA